MKKIIMCLVLSACLAISLWSSFQEEFMEAYQKSQEEGVEINLEEWAAKAETVEDHRVFQGYYNHEDPEACQAYYDSLLAKNPDDPVFKYLSIRMLDDDITYVKCKEIIAAHPDFYWGYRVLVVRMLEFLQEDDAQDYIDGADYPKDMELVEQGLEHFPEDGFLQAAIFSDSIQKKELKKAEEALLKIDDGSALNSVFNTALGFLKDHKKAQLLEPLLKKMYQPDESDEESVQRFLGTYLYYLNQFEDARLIKDYLENHPELASNLPARWYLLQANLKDGQYDAAMDDVEKMVKEDQLDWLTIKSVNNFEPLEDNPRWTKITADLEAKWKADAPARRQEAIKERTDTIAPLWELKGLNDTVVRLEDLKGKVVVLDFWATWCGPCRAAMPALDVWMKEEMPPGVEVFSINTWERDPQLAIDMMAKENYAMTLLFGDGDLPKLYKFDGIPYICVIDKQGKIAFSQSGYSADLDEKLGFWVDALINE